MTDLELLISDKTEESLVCELLGEVDAYLYLYCHIHGKDFVHFSGLSILTVRRLSAVVFSRNSGIDQEG